MVSTRICKCRMLFYESLPGHLWWGREMRHKNVCLALLRFSYKCVPADGGGVSVSLDCVNVIILPWKKGVEEVEEEEEESLLYVS